MEVAWETYKLGCIILYFEGLQGWGVPGITVYSFFFNDFQHPTPVPLSTTFFFVQNAWHIEQASDVHYSAYQVENLEWWLVSNKVIFLSTCLKKKKIEEPANQLSSHYSFWAYQQHFQSNLHHSRRKWRTRFSLYSSCSRLPSASSWRVLFP